MSKGISIAKQTGVAIREYDKRIAELEQQLSEWRAVGKRVLRNRKASSPGWGEYCGVYADVAALLKQGGGGRRSVWK